MLDFLYVQVHLLVRKTVRRTYGQLVN
jgi:hypothetical protein